MKILSGPFAPTAAAVLLMFTASPAFAGPPTDQLRSRVDKVSTVLEDPALRGDDKAVQRRAEIRKVADDIFDFGEMAKRSLGRHWDERTATERAEFVSLFTDLLRRAYYSKIEKATFDKILFRGEKQQGDDALVRTLVVLPHGEQMNLDYALILVGERWKVYDLRIEGISLVSNYRSQFSRIIRTTSYEELVAKLKSNQTAFSAP